MDLTLMHSSIFFAISSHGILMCDFHPSQHYKGTEHPITTSPSHNLRFGCIYILRNDQRRSKVHIIGLQQ